MRALCTFLGLLLIAALAVGAIVGNSERLNPSMHAARVDRLEAEAEAIRAQTAYEEQKHQIELQALREREARRQEMQEPVTIAGLITGSIVATCLVTSLSYYLVARGQALSGRHEENWTSGRRHITEPASPMERQKGTARRDPGPLMIERANVSPSRVTYDGLLAYFNDFFLSPNGTVIFYTKGISPAVAEFYRTVLQQARIITAGSSGHFEWTLQRRITCIDDVRERISRQAFDRLA
jgi:hypothetical protein